MPLRVIMVAGEASGDVHGAGVVRALRAMAPGTSVSGIGGDMMQREGMRLIHHSGDLAFMGFAEVIRNLGTIRRVERELLGEIDREPPDVVVLIDYPGFNLRLARKMKKRNIPVLYYISPQVWAWNSGRIKKIAHLVDRMKVVFPFEVEMYREAGMNVECVGHPLVDHLRTRSTREEFFRRNRLDGTTKLLGLFPGSRVQEIERILPVMAAAAEQLASRGGLQVALGVASNLGPELIRKRLPSHTRCVLIENETYDLMAYADAAIVTSGTATLETGWFGTPMAVVYRTSPVTFFIGRMLVNVPYIGLVNIVAGRKIVPEFVQQKMTVSNLTAAIGRMLDDPVYAAAMRRDLGIIREKLGGPGAAEKVARGILELAGAA